MSTFVADFYHLNFYQDAPLPVTKVLSDARIVGIILKFSQGTSYGDWAEHQAAAVRSSRAPLGGYHMLDGGAGSGIQQAAYFLGKLKPQPGDIVPVMDFEASGRGGASITAYRALGEAFIAAIHTAGFEVMLYGHADVKAAWNDWRDSGADYWWQPGDQIHADVGPQGPDLWQYGPYASPFDYPTDPLGTGQRADMSIVLTHLPIIGGGDDVTGDDIVKGWRYRKDNPDKPLPKDASDGFEVGWHQREIAEQAGKPGPPGPAGPAGPKGPQGPPGKAAVIKPGSHLVVSDN